MTRAVNIPIALSDLEGRSGDKGANAVVGADPDCEAINTMLMASANGTAATLE